MSLPRKHIAEGIAVALMVGVGGERSALHHGGIFAATDDDVMQKMGALAQSIGIVGRRSSCDSMRALTLMRALEASVHAIGVCGKDVSDASRLFWTNPASFKRAQHDFYAMTNVNDSERTGDT